VVEFAKPTTTTTRRHRVKYSTINALVILVHRCRLDIKTIDTAIESFTRVLQDVFSDCKSTVYTSTEKTF
jgi:hypothetical protein